MHFPDTSQIIAVIPFKYNKVPRVVSEELIEIASSSRSPVAFDFLILSEPARSTR